MKFSNIDGAMPQRIRKGDEFNFSLSGGGIYFQLVTSSKTGCIDLSTFSSSRAGRLAVKVIVEDCQRNGIDWQVYIVWNGQYRTDLFRLNKSHIDKYAHA